MSAEAPSSRRIADRPRGPWLVGIGAGGALVGLALGLGVAGSGPEERHDCDAISLDAGVEQAPGTPALEAPPSPSTSGTSTAVQASGGAMSQAPRPLDLRWLALGGGADPASNQVSMEQDLLLAREVLGDRGPGALFYGSSHGTTLVQIRDERLLDDGLTPALAKLFDPLREREIRYRPSLLTPDAPASRGGFLAALRAAVASPNAGPLLVYVAAHGDVGEHARDNSIVFWGGEALRVSELAAELDARPPARPLLLVVSSCYAGGFAELAFAGAESARGASGAEQCGLYASTWDRTAEGCDPNPDRRAQESYGLHFLNALRGTDRQGQPVPRAELDLDGDGRIDTAEAHARVRIASRSISVPTSSSERWLRQVAPVTGPALPVEMPDEEAVVAALGRALRIDSLSGALGREQELEESVKRLDEALERLELEQDVRWQALATRLLERWPTLGDPWHRDHAQTLARDREAIAAVLADSPEAAGYRSVEAAVGRLAAHIDELETELALVERLVRAHENLELAARLRAQGGSGFVQFERLRRCERSWPSGR